LTSPTDRQKALKILDAGVADGARNSELALLLAWGLRRCNGGGVSSLVTVMALTAARAASATSPIASAKKNASGSC
jgi:hypothetical protein